MRETKQNRKMVVARWLAGLFFASVLSGGPTLGQEKWKSYVKGPGATYVVGCLYHVPQKVLTFDASTGSQTVTVETHGSCPWTFTIPSSAQGWVGIAKDGEDKQVAHIDVAANGSVDPRCTDIEVAGFKVRVQQDGAGTETVAVLPRTLEISGQEGYVLQGIHASSPDGAARYSSSPDSWLSVLSGCGFSFETWVLLKAGMNSTGKARIGSVQVGGRWVTVIQQPWQQ